MDSVKNSILALFGDNVTGSISAADMRIFVNSIFDSKENEIHVFEKLSDITNYRSDSNTVYPISKFDIIVITDENYINNYGSEKGIYISLKDSPGENDVFKVSSLNYDEFIKLGQTGQLISLDSNNELAWIDQTEGYFIEGAENISEILNKRPSQKGPIWIANNTELLAPVPGKEGDGYSWTGSEWVNIGPLRGPEGDVVQVAFANQFEVDSGYIDYKAISPKTFKNSSIIQNKEEKLGNPSISGQMLISDTSGNRSWKTPVKVMNNLEDVNYSIIDDNSILVYSNNYWNPRKLTDVFTNSLIGLSDTPSYYGNAGDALVINASKTGFGYNSIPKRLSDLDDVSNNLSPLNDYVLKYSASSSKWVALPDSTLNGNSAQRPLNPRIGTMFFDIELNIPIWYNGNRWVDANGNQK